MSHNPNTVKSQDDINEGGRKSDVLLSTIEKTNDLYEQNQEYIGAIAELGREKERLRKQLDIAVKCLKQYADRDNWYNTYKPNSLDECPIGSKERWKKEYGYKQAEKALKKIED